MTTPSETDRDMLLSHLLGELQPRRFASRWASVPKPYSALIAECRALLTDAGPPVALCAYLQANPVIQQSVETLISYQAFVSNARWQDVPPLQQSLARRGWHLARWLPTFLLIDAPTGRVLTDSTSPFNQLLRTAHRDFPVLTAARDAFNDSFFTLVRNSVAHWSFTWTDASPQSFLTLYGEDGGAPTRVLLLEAEALHLVAHAVIRELGREVFDRLNPVRHDA